MDRNAPSARTPELREADETRPLPAVSSGPGSATRTNDKLLVDSNFRQVIQDILRLRLVNGFGERRRDTLTLHLEDEALTSASTDQNLDRVYQAYRGPMDNNSEGSLELLHDNRRVGLYTRRGLSWEAVRTTLTGRVGAAF